MPCWILRVLTGFRNDCPARNASVFRCLENMRSEGNLIQDITGQRGRKTFFNPARIQSGSMDRPKIVSLKDPELTLPSVHELPPAAPPDVPPLPEEKTGPKPLMFDVSRKTEPEPLTPPSSLPEESEIPPSRPAPAMPSEPALSEPLERTETIQPLPQPEAPPLLPEPPKIPAAGAPPWWVDRQKPSVPEREDDLARELSSPRVVSVESPKITRAYQDAAARDMLPPQVGPQPMTAESERAKAKSLAQEIHEKNQSTGIFGKLKRALGLR